MRIRALAVAALLPAFGAVPAAAQSRPIVGVSYDMSLPTGDLKTYADNDSWLGWSVDVRAFGESNKISFGGMLGYYEFYNNTATDQITFQQYARDRRKANVHRGARAGDEVARNSQAAWVR